MGLPLLQTPLAMGPESSDEQEMPRRGQGRWQVDPFDYPWGGWPGDGADIQGDADVHYPLEGGMWVGLPGHQASVSVKPSGS